VQELASGDAVTIGGVTAGGIRSSITTTITIRIRCVAVLYSFFFLFFYAHSFPCYDPQTTGCRGSSVAVRVEEEREFLLPFPKLSKLGARKRYLPSCSSFELCTDISSLQAKERGVASAGASSVMIKSNFTRSEFVILGSDHSKSPALSPLLCIKYREEIVAGVPQRKLSCGL